MKRILSPTTGEILIHFCNYDVVSWCGFCGEKVRNRKGFKSMNGTNSVICFECVYWMASILANKHNLPTHDKEETYENILSSGMER